MEVDKEDVGGIEGILSRLEKERSTSHGLGSGKRLWTNGDYDRGNAG